MDSINSRIKSLNVALGVSQNAFAKALNTSSSRISNIINERNKPDSDLLSMVLRVYRNVNPDWLMMNEGSMFRNVNIPQEGDGDVPLKSTSKSTIISKSKELEVHMAAEPPPPLYGTHKTDEQIDFLSKLLKEREHVIISQERELKSQQKIIELLEEKLNFTQRHTVGKAGSVTTQETT